MISWHFYHRSIAYSSLKVFQKWLILPIYHSCFWLLPLKAQSQTWKNIKLVYHLASVLKTLIRPKGMDAFNQLLPVPILTYLDNHHFKLFLSGTLLLNAFFTVENFYFFSLSDFKHWDENAKPLWENWKRLGRKKAFSFKLQILYFCTFRIQETRSL